MAGKQTAVRATSGAAWRKERRATFLKTLATGKVVRLRAVDVNLLVLSGNVPDLLTPVVLGMIYRGIDATRRDATDIATERHNKLTNLFTQGTYAKWTDADRAMVMHELLGASSEEIELYDLICRLALVEPCIADDPIEDSEIALSDLHINERMQIFYMVTQGVEALESFPDGPRPDLAALPDGAEIGAATEHITSGEGDVGSTDV